MTLTACRIARTARLAYTVALGTALLLAAGCSANSTGRAGTAPPPASSATASSSAVATRNPSAATSAAATATSAPLPADLAHLRVRLVRLWSGFDHPLYLTNAGDGSKRLFVVEQGGTVRVIRNGKVARKTYLDVSSLVLSGGERGLLGMAFAPDFAHNGHVYIDYTDANGDTVVARYIADDPTSDTPTWRVQRLLHVGQPYSNHNGGCLQFGPDGYLWIGMGDGGSEGDPGNRGQNDHILLGKLLRIDAEGPTAGATYAIPPGQPARPGWAPEIWATGLRNPWRFSFDASGDALWIADVGQDAWEEVDVVSPALPGLNLGWPLWEGNHPYRSGATRDSFVFPAFEYPHPLGGSISGGYVYRGAKYPALVGTYLFGDYVKGWLGAVRTTSPSGTPLSKPQGGKLIATNGPPSSLGVDEAGELYLVDYTGSVWGITASAR